MLEVKGVSNSFGLLTINAKGLCGTVLHQIARVMSAAVTPDS